jgi:hypothetical protein
MKWLYQVHKWLAVVATVATLAWFVSGVVMEVPAGYRTLTPGVPGDINAVLLPETPPFEEAIVSVSSAIGAVRARLDKPVRVVSVRLRRLPGRIAYEVGTVAHGSHLVDAISGGVLVVDEALATRITATALGRSAGLGAATLQTAAPTDCPGRLLPGYRVELHDGKGTAFCVSAATGDYQHSDRLMRMTGAVMRWHEFGPMLRWLSSGSVRGLLLGFGVIGTLMSAFGVLILWVQLQRWWQRTRARAIASRRLDGI